MPRMAGLRSVLSRNLRVLRHARGLSQEDVAGHAEIDRGHISELENGKYGPSIETLEVLAAALEVEPWELLHPDTAERYRAKT